jgi:hypothetical protein
VKIPILLPSLGLANDIGAFLVIVDPFFITSNYY